MGINFLLQCLKKIRLHNYGEGGIFKIIYMAGVEFIHS